MFRIAMALAVIATMCVLSPERSSRSDSVAADKGQAPGGPPSLDSVATHAAGQIWAKARGTVEDEASAALIPAAREAASAGLDKVRKVVAVSQAPLEMPPLRR